MVIEVIDKPLLHQLNIAIKEREKSGGCQLGQNLGKKSGGFQFWSKPGGKQSGGFQFWSKPGKKKVEAYNFGLC